MSAIPVALTVLGPVAVSELGVTLPHEHLHMDASPLLAIHGYAARMDGPFSVEAAGEARWDPGSHPDNYRFTRDDLVIEELRTVRDLGGGCVVDLTPPSLGRDPVALAAISRAAGLHVVMGTGHYLARTHDAALADTPSHQIADALMREVHDGVAGTGIRPGILGEIGTGDPVDPRELHVLDAVALASRETGLAISVHLHPWGRTGPLVLERLVTAGMAPERVILGHATTAWNDPDHLRGLLDRGAVLGFDLFGFDHSLLGLGRWPPADVDVVRTVATLVGEGYAGQLLLSQDVGVRTRLQAFGGWGFSHLQRHVVPMLEAAGVPLAAIDTMLVSNPARLLTVGLPTPSRA